MNKILLISLLLLPLPAIAQPVDSNYVRTDRYLDAAGQRRISEMSYNYNANGALLRDPNKMDADISYDLLGWPMEITLQRATNRYVYSARGEKLRVWTQLNGLIPIVPPVRPTESNATTDRKAPATQDLKPGHPLLRYLRDTRYCGPFILEQGKLSMFLFDGGYISFGNGQTAWHYYIKDHLGNTRAVINEQGQVEQATNYYPFGGVYGNEEINAKLQPYKYNGKELDHTSGLDWYDYGARMYDPVLGQWTGQDPLAEKFYNISQYAYCHCSPLARIDLDGKADYIIDNRGYMHESTSLWYRIKSLLGLGEKQDRIFMDGSSQVLASFPEGTISLKQNDKNITHVEIKGNKQADRFADVVMKQTDVEWARIQHGDRRSSSNTIQNNHSDENVNSIVPVLKYYRSKGQTIFLFDHSHPVPQKYKGTNAEFILNIRVSPEDVQTASFFKPKISRVFNKQSNKIEYYNSEGVYRYEEWK